MSPDESRAERTRVLAGHIVQTPGAEHPYKVVLEYEGNAVSEHPVSTMQEGEALIKAKLPSRQQGPKELFHPFRDGT